MGRRHKPAQSAPPSSHLRTGTPEAIGNGILYPGPGQAARAFDQSLGQYHYVLRGAGSRTCPANDRKPKRRTDLHGHCAGLGISRWGGEGGWVLVRSGESGSSGRQVGDSAPPIGRRRDRSPRPRYFIMSATAGVAGESSAKLTQSASNRWYGSISARVSWSVPSTSTPTHSMLGVN